MRINRSVCLDGKGLFQRKQVCVFVLCILLLVTSVSIFGPELASGSACLVVFMTRPPLPSPVLKLYTTAKMAAKSVDLMTEKLIKVQEVFDRIDPRMFSKVMEPGLFVMMDEIVNTVARKRLPEGVWDGLPEAVRHETIFKALDDSPQFLSNFMAEMKQDIDT